MDNPYQTPAPDKPHASDASEGKLPMQPERGLVGHVRVICILMYVQGGLELLMAAYFLVMGGIYPLLMKAMMEASEGGDAGSGAPPVAAIWLTGGILIVFGVLLLIVAVLHIFAAYRNYQFRSRTLGIVALAVGCATVMTCYCAPTAIALAVYGLIVYLSPQPSLAFLFGDQGHAADDILASFPSS